MSNINTNSLFALADEITTLRARIAELEREVVRLDLDRCDLEADLQDATGLSCEDGLRDMVFELVGLWRKSKARAEELEREVGYRSTGLMSGVQASVVLDNARFVGRIAELERERDALTKRVSDLEYHLDSHVRATDKAQADAARLREALEEVRRRIEVMGVGEQSDSVRVHNRLLNQSEDALKVIINALTSAPSAVDDGLPDTAHMNGVADPTPRDIRIACRVWTHGFAKGREYEELDTLEAIQRVGEFTLGEGIDIAAVVANVHSWDKRAFGQQNEAVKP